MSCSPANVFGCDRLVLFRHPAAAAPADSCGIGASRRGRGLRAAMDGVGAFGIVQPGVGGEPWRLQR